jgi:hypothetical protein
MSDDASDDDDNNNSKHGDVDVPNKRARVRPPPSSKKRYDARHQQNTSSKKRLDANRTDPRKRHLPDDSMDDGMDVVDEPYMDDGDEPYHYPYDDPYMDDVDDYLASLKELKGNKNVNVEDKFNIFFEVFKKISNEYIDFNLQGRYLNVDDEDFPKGERKMNYNGLIRDIGRTRELISDLNDKLDEYETNAEEIMKNLR